MAQRVGGTIRVKVDSQHLYAKGNFTFSLGTPKREAVMGADGFHGYKETPQVAYVEGEITETINTDLETLFNVTNATVELSLANGKDYVWTGAYYAGDGTAETEEGNAKFRMEAEKGEQV